MSTPSAAIDPSRCPLCGQPNRCAREVERASGAPQPPCWCVQADFPAGLLNRVPPPLRGQACICPGCASSSAAAD